MDRFHWRPSDLTPRSPTAGESAPFFVPIGVPPGAPGRVFFCGFPLVFLVLLLFRTFQDIFRKPLGMGFWRSPFRRHTRSQYNKNFCRRRLTLTFGLMTSLLGRPPCSPDPFPRITAQLYSFLCRFSFWPSFLQSTGLTPLYFSFPSVDSFCSFFCFAVFFFCGKFPIFGFSLGFEGSQATLGPICPRLSHSLVLCVSFSHSRLVGLGGSSSPPFRNSSSRFPFFSVF